VNFATPRQYTWLFMPPGNQLFEDYSAEVCVGVGILTIAPRLGAADGRYLCKREFFNPGSTV
jgi:hypothetical protein